MAKAPFLAMNFSILPTFLARSKVGPFLSINDAPEIREIFSRFTFTIEGVSLNYSVARDKSTTAKELIIGDP